MSFESRGEAVRPLEQFPIPYGKQVEHLEVTYEDGLPMLRLRIREGKRFTMLDLDPETAEAWGRRMLEWAEARKAQTGSE